MLHGTSKWQTHLPCLHQETLIHCLTSIKTQTINNQPADATPGNRACYVRMLSPGESPESLPVGPRSHECDNKQTRK